MSRAGKNKKRLASPDPIYQSRLVARLINRVMRQGKKSIAQKQVYRTFDLVGKQTEEEPLEVYRKALENIKPTMEVRSRRVGGASYQVPVPVRGDRREALAVRWLIQAARVSRGKEVKTFYQGLASEIVAAYRNEGKAIEKKQQIHKMAEANRAFAHFRW